MLFFGNAARDKYSEVPNSFVNSVDYGLPIRSDLVNIVIEIENPAERLLRRCDVVALRTENHDG